jgi:hypothetical protein
MPRLPKSVRQQVRQRATACCEYCGKPEGFSPIEHQIDHVIAVQHGGSDAIDNLVYACFRCNNKKGSNIASLDRDTDQLVPLFNPRTDTWGDHFFEDDGQIKAKTSTGRVTVLVLGFNDPKEVELRKLFIQANLWHYSRS